jgi:hypothetical protein
MATRVFSGAHYFSDGVGGALVGVISSVLCIKIYLYLNKVSRRNGTAILNSEPSLVYKKRPEWKPVIERGQVAYELQVSDNVQASNTVEVSNGVEVSGNLQAADRARVSTRP